MTINKALEAGASDYLQKPLARDLLGTGLGMLMAMRRSGKHLDELAWSVDGDTSTSSTLPPDRAFLAGAQKRRSM